jgi:hypothetical protein
VIRKILRPWRSAAEAPEQSHTKKAAVVPTLQSELDLLAASFGDAQKVVSNSKMGPASKPKKALEQDLDDLASEFQHRFFSNLERAEDESAPSLVATQSHSLR